MPADRRTPSIEAILGRPFAEAVEALTRRLEQRVPTRTWRDLLREQHDRAFVVAGAMEAALLDDLAEAVRAAVERGESLEAFRRRFMTIIEERGWKGFTGDRGPAARAWRTRVIYSTNQAVSYAAGRRKQLVEGGFSYWVYFHSHLSIDPRPEHLAWDGTALPPDHPWWQLHYPPNGWGCRCYVVGARSREAAVALGARRFEAPTPPGDRTGVQEGWDYAPGASVQRDLRPIVAALARVQEPELRREAQADAAQSRWITPDDPPDRIPDLAAEAGRELLDRVLEAAVPETGRSIRQELDELGPALAKKVPERAAIERQRELLALAHARLVERLRAERVYGTAEPALTGKRADVAKVADALKQLLPAEWLANVTTPVRIRISRLRAFYNHIEKSITILPPEHPLGPVTAAHEWLHHAQFAWPQLQNACTFEHAARTEGAPQQRLGIELNGFGRRDKYYDAYMGREYFPSESVMLSRPYEVLTMAAEVVMDQKQFAKAWRAGDMRTIEFAIGLFRRWRP